MLKELNDRLMEVKEKLRIKRRLMQSAKHTETELSQEKARLAELNARLSKEGKDVQDLEGLSLKGLFYSILGSKEDQLDKERQEYLSFKLKHDECQNSVDMLQSRLEEINREIVKLGDIDRQYEAIFEQKEKVIMSGSDVNAEKLILLSEKAADIRSDVKELWEALNTGQEALTGINSVVDSLKSARGWGTWDMLGGGLISTAVKHSRIDDAKRAVHRVQHQLRLFQNELKDVDPYLNSDIMIDIGSFATFADYIFDGLITDWIVQSRINVSLVNAARVRDNVSDTLKSLQQAIDMKQLELEKVEKERRELIENVG
ncbi:MAG: hypothetical protein CVU89_15150 [Firmicutes bacterium HGW-Firmicutes-14]|nr:MAG: hypothetical protein CVU89_15150 [Firmicutes bacterium HGW-Firmicutes-14]